MIGKVSDFIVVVVVQEQDGVSWAFHLNGLMERNIHVCLRWQNVLHQTQMRLIFLSGPFLCSLDAV